MAKSSEFAQEILEAGLLEMCEPREFAGGDIANNHLNLDRLNEHEELFDRVTSAMAHLILAHECRIDFLLPIPSGGNIFAEAISQKLATRERQRIPVVEFKKTPEGLFTPLGSYARQRLSRSGHGVIIDDVTTRLSTLERFLKIPELRARKLSFCAVWRRGTEDMELSINDAIDKYWLVEEPIPFTIDETSSYWEYAGKEMNS